MSAAEFRDWLVFMDVEGIGPGAELSRWAQTMAAAANGQLIKKDKSMFQAAEFMPRRWTPRPQATPATGASARAFVHALRAQTSLN
jgi:hypothetical protein